MDDIAFNWPKKIFRALILAVFVVASLWGLITWDARNASEVLVKGITLVMTPVLNVAKNRAERAIDGAFQSMSELPLNEDSPH